jgi:hypothetical protein
MKPHKKKREVMIANAPPDRSLFPEDVVPLEVGMDAIGFGLLRGGS